MPWWLILLQVTKDRGLQTQTPLPEPEQENGPKRLSVTHPGSQGPPTPTPTDDKHPQVAKRGTQPREIIPHPPHQISRI